MNADSRQSVIHRGQRLQIFTVAYNSLEAVVALISSLLSGSIALLGFGLDSLIEVTSGGAVLWRLRRDDEHAERRALKVVGACFLALAVYIAADSGHSLWAQEKPEHSWPGIALAVVSLIVMPLLARAKRRVAGHLGSRAVAADARQTDFCTYLSAILLGGLLANALLGWWWADPAAGLAMAPIMAWEGKKALEKA